MVRRRRLAAPRASDGVVIDRARCFGLARQATLRRASDVESGALHATGPVRGQGIADIRGWIEGRDFGPAALARAWRDRHGEPIGSAPAVEPRVEIGYLRNLERRPAAKADFEEIIGARQVGKRLVEGFDFLGDSAVASSLTKLT